MKPFEQFDYLELEGEGVTEVGDKLSVTYFCYPDGTKEGGRFVHGRIEVDSKLFGKSLLEEFIKEQKKIFDEMTKCLNEIEVVNHE